MKHISLAIILIAACAIAVSIPASDTAGTAFAQAKKTLYYFYGRNCPHCAQAVTIVDRLGRQYNLDVKRFEVWYDANNRNMLIKMGKERGKNVQGVPTIIIGRGVYTGSSGQKMEDVVRANLK